MVKTTLGWKKALEHAETIVTDGELSREQHLRIFKKMLESKNDQDQRIAIGLLKQFIEMYPSDFDKDLNHDDLYDYGTSLTNPYWKNFGRYVLYPIMKLRGVPAIWIDRIADEGPVSLRQSFVQALEELAKRKSNPLDRILGILRYFIDDPSTEVRDLLIRIAKIIGKRDVELFHYFLMEHETGAGSHRLAYIKAAREAVGLETEKGEPGDDSMTSGASE